MRASDDSGTGTLGRRALLRTAGGLVLLAAGARAASAAAPVKADRVVVRKGERQMLLIRGGRVLRRYRVALGRYPVGRKLGIGDGRTPEGVYTLESRLADSKFHKAIRISYPNRRDAERARRAGRRPGGDIMIHGLPEDWTAEELNHPELDWTQGCIAVTNREMDEIWALVDDGTPIAILP